MNYELMKLRDIVINVKVIEKLVQVRVSLNNKKYIHNTIIISKINKYSAMALGKTA